MDARVELEMLVGKTFGEACEKWRMKVSNFQKISFNVVLEFGCF